MGIISNLLGYVTPEQPPQLKSIYPIAATNKVMSGMLPIISADKIILLPNETCHFVDVATIVTKKTRRKTFHTGGSYRVFKGYTAHLGQSQSVPIEESHYTNGILYVTNQRVIFVARENGFDKKIKTITAITPYNNAISLQFSGKSQTLLIPSAIALNAVLNMLL